MSVLTDIKNRGVKYTFLLVCDGIKGLPDGRSDLHYPPEPEYLRLASKEDWDALNRDVRPVYTAPNAAAARAALEELRERWGRKYGAIVRLWENAWEEFIPVLDYDVEILRVICSLR